MNFQNLLNIESEKHYLDRAFSTAREKAKLLQQQKSHKKYIDKQKDKELMRIVVVKNSLINALMKILKSYPNVDELPEFYQELVKCYFEIRELKRALYTLHWGTNKIDEFYYLYHKKISRTMDLKHVASYRKEYYGRVSSLMRQIGPALIYLEQVRRELKGFPTIKTSVFSVALFGFPNVGKTTLFFHLTGSKPEISNYAFTTKNLNVGYAKMMVDGNLQRVQYIDTPGSLDRFSKMNPIERQAYLALEWVAHRVVYIFDLTEASYPLEEQIALYENIKKRKKDVIVYLSKADIMNPDIVKRKEEFLKRYKALTTPEEVREALLASLKEWTDAQQSS